MCEAIDPDFNISRVVFSGIELMNLINSEQLKRGSCIAFEEGGIEMGNREWQSVTNKMLSFLLQTFRHRGFILVMNSPYMDFVDASTRKLFHAEFQTVGIDFKENDVKLKPHLIQYNSRLKKFYYKRLQVITDEGLVPVDIWRVGKPSKELITAYEKRKREFTDDLNKRIMNELLAVEEKRNKKQTKKLLTRVQEETLELLKEGLTTDEIAKRRDRHPRVVRVGINQLRLKGYEVTPVFEHGALMRYTVREPASKDKKATGGGSSAV